MEPRDNQSYIRQELQSLQHASGLFRSLMGSSKYGIAFMTVDRRVVAVNETMRSWFPRIDTAALPLCHSCLYSCRETACENCPAGESLRTGSDTTSLIEHTSDDGGFSCYRVTCSPLKDLDGSVQGIIEIAENITAAVTDAREHRDHEKLYRQIMESANDAILVFSCDGTVIAANKKTAQLLGYAPEELLGKPFHLLLPEEMRDREMQALQLFLRSGTIETNRTFEGIFLKKDGGRIPIETTFSVQISPRSSTITAIVRYISERTLHEKDLKTHAEELEQEVEKRTRELARSEAQYRMLLETANDAIISADREGRIIYFNKKAEEIFGYRRDAVLAKSILEIAPRDILDAAARGGQGNMIESWGQKRDGGTFPAEYAMSVFEKDGDYTVTLIVRDITGRKILEQEVQQYTAKLEEKVRERTYELTASQQILKGKISELSILKEISEALASAMGIEAVLNIILVGATSHHGLGFNRAFLFLISDDGKYLEGKVAIGPSDTSEAQKIWGEILGKNLTLKEILQSYTNKTGKVDTHVNNIVRSIRISMADDADVLVKTIKSGESLNVRDAFNHPMVPHSLVNLMNCSAFALIPLAAAGNALGVLWADNAITKNPIDGHDIERLRAFAINASLAIQKSNLIKNIQEKVTQLDLANRELKQNRDRLIRSEKLAAVGEMSATVAHGLRNPLVSIGGFARRLLKKEQEDSTNRKYLQIIVDEIDRLETILSELLDFVRPQKLHLKSVNIKEILENALELFQPELLKRNILTERVFRQDLPRLDIDADQFRRVLQNLFYNAADAMPGGGTIKITTDIEETWVKISIADTGTGIASDDIEKVFHPFFTSKSSSSGLGLAVCNQIISIHGGHIRLRRQIPLGVIFDLFLPVPEEGAGQER